MQHLPYFLRIFVGGLCLTFFADPSFGSDRFTHEEPQEQIRTAATAPQIAVPFSPESALPSDVRIFILSFVSDQKNLLHIGAVSKSWRKAAGKVWEKRWLDLSNKRLTADHYKILKKGISPRLCLNNVKLDEKGMNILAACSHLQALELRGNNLRATEALIKLLSLSHLYHLDLYSNMIGVEGAKVIAEALSQNRRLTTVYLGYNRLGTEGAKAIAGALSQNKTLTTVNLYGNSIGDEGAKAIAGALIQNRTLTTVKLGGNKIGDVGIGAMADALKQNTTLTTVDLGENSIGDEGKKALEDLKRSRPSLQIFY